MSAKRKIAYNVLYAIILVAIVFAAWAIAAAAIDSEFVLPGIADTFAELGRVLTLKTFWTALSGTLLRSLIGYSISLALFFALFFFATAFTSVRKITQPLISAMRTLPTMAVALILAVWAGVYAAPIVLGVIVILPQLYSSATAHNASVPTELVEVNRLCGATKTQNFFSLYLPYAASAFPESLASAFSFNIKIVIAAEILMQTANSLGMLMRLSEIYLQTASLIAMTFAAVVVSVACEFAIRSVLKLALRKYALE